MPSQKLIKKHMCSKPDKIPTNSTMGAQGLDFGHLLVPFAHPFFIKFRDRPNLLNCNKHGVKTILLPLQASHSGIENPLKIHVFSRHPLGPHFSSFYMNLCQKNSIVGPPSKSNGCNIARALLRPLNQSAPQRRPAAPRSHFLYIFIDFGTPQASVLMIWGTILVSFFAFRRTVKHQTQ